VSRLAFALVLAVAIAGAIGAVAANLVVGGRLFEPTVVEDPCQAGLRYDADRRRAAGVDCDLARGPCRRETAQGEVALEVAPRPPRAMADLEFAVRAPPGFGSGQVALSMPGMTMVENRVSLAPGADGALRGRGVVVRCPSGDRVWRAAVTLSPAAAGAPPLTATFTFEVGE